jgi:hypothetical protein
VGWKQALNAGLSRTTGLELRKAQAIPRRRSKILRPGDRLLEAPAFILCTVRSGSTLLRTILDSHSRVHSPHELHLRDLAVTSKSEYSDRSLEEIGLDARLLEYLLWDRLLHRELEQSGKQQLVNKTPSDVFIADRIIECWPDARFIFLLRHPLAVARSRHELRPQDTEERNLKMVLRYGNAVEAARQAYPGITVRYEDLAADPTTVVQELCGFLGLPWEPEMLEYGRFSHGRYKPGLGDWKDKIRSGSVQPPAPLPPADEIPPALRSLSTAWGYLPAQDGEVLVSPVVEAPDPSEPIGL